MVKIETTKMSFKGQVVILVEFRKGIKEGDTLVIFQGEDKIILKKASALDKQFAEDLEFARKTERAWKEIEERKGTKTSIEDFLKEMKSW